MNKFYYRSSSTIFFQMGDKYVIGYGSMQELFDKDTFVNIRSVLEYLSVPRSFEELKSYLSEMCIPEGIIDICMEKKYITSNRYVISNRTDRTDYKNVLFVDCSYDNSETVLKNIKESTLINIGCGGIGNYLLYTYASFLPKRIVMIDGDSVSLSNLNRQILFSIEDVGSKKCEVLRRELTKRFNSVKYDAICEYATYDLLRKVVENNQGENLLITISGDNSTTVNDAIRVAAEYSIPCLNIGYLNDYAVIGPFYIPEIGACPFCNDMGADYTENKYEDMEMLNSFYRAPSSFINSSMATAMAMSDILHFFSEKYENINSLNSRIGIGTLNFNVERIEVTRDEHCRVCGRKTT